jgi:hypothetical protein
VGAQIQKLIAFFQDIAAIDLSSADKVNITDAELHRLALSRDQVASLVQDNQDIFAEALRSEVTKEDIVALGYRKHQLHTFERLLGEPDYFELIREKRAHAGQKRSGRCSSRKISGSLGTV